MRREKVILVKIRIGLWVKAGKNLSKNYETEFR